MAGGGLNCHRPMTMSLSRKPLTPGDWFAVEYDPKGPAVVMMDQRKLPEQLHYVRCETPDEVATGIRDMLVRGAPAIGISAAYGLALQAHTDDSDAAGFLLAQGAAGRVLNQTRPTAVNLAWAVSRMAKRAAEVAALSREERAQAMLVEAETIHREDIEACKRMGAEGARDIISTLENTEAPGKGSDAEIVVLTHCNAGALATGGYGTALGVIRALKEAGKKVRVLADETRPYLQGARLTAWELNRDGIDVEVITDNMAGYFFAQGAIDWVVVGSDRIAKNADVANKIGTYSVAVLAAAHGVPFTVAAPFSTVDLLAASGMDIPIEERSSDEVAKVGSKQLVPEGVRCRHPAFDVTPARLVDAIYTERGTLRPKEGQTPEQLLVL